MKVLLLGETGLIGLRLKNSLMAMNIPMVNLCRKDLDFLNADSNKFLTFLDDITVIVNAVGVMSNDKVILEQIHHYAPKRFANVAKQYAKKHQKTLHWINISAIGADPSSDIAFIGSKGRGDKAIMDLSDDDFKVTIVRPSLVFSPIGASTKLFLQLAKLPVLALPNGGLFVVQPVELNDVVLGILTLIKVGHKKPIIYFVGRPIYFCDYLNLLRKHHHHKNASKILNIPIQMMIILLKFPIIRLLIGLLFKKYSPLLSWQNLQLLNNNMVYNSDDFLELLGKDIKTAEQFIKK